MSFRLMAERCRSVAAFSESVVSAKRPSALILRSSSRIRA
jgi:hypothetical protein